MAHCGEHLDGSFLYTMTLTDLATGWTECIPLLEKRADAVQAVLSQARTLFPFPLLGIDADSGSEFLNEQVMMYCEQEHLTFTRGRPGVKNDQAHVEQKNRAVVREVVGCVRLVGVRAYRQLGEVYRVLRLVVNCFQPSFKLQAKVLQRDRVHRVYDVAQTPLQRALASGVLPEEQQHDLSKWVQRIDPLALSEHLDALRYALLCEAHLPPAVGASGRAWPPLRFCLAACMSEPLPAPEREPEQTGSLEVPGREEILALLQAHPEWTSTQIVQGIEHQVPDRAVFAPLETHISVICPPGCSTWEDSWLLERLQGGQAEPLPEEPSSSEEVISDADQCAVQASPLPALAFGTSSRTVGEHEGVMVSQ
ncbi:hypothetical protein KSC_043220 [Ktedonobacter sp. SOSP1-52]|nr:hypothetical protein KSC_043220 [Ktedonobacter sp. SOSP1-52]